MFVELSLIEIEIVSARMYSITNKAISVENHIPLGTINRRSQTARKKLLSRLLDKAMDEGYNPLGWLHHAPNGKNTPHSERSSDFYHPMKTS